jgi:hypothetical protein
MLTEVLSDEEMSSCGTGGPSHRVNFAMVPRRQLIDCLPLLPPPNGTRTHFLALRALVKE